MSNRLDKEGKQDPLKCADLQDTKVSNQGEETRKLTFWEFIREERRPKSGVEGTLNADTRDERD
jgi:hypothetical protein